MYSLLAMSWAVVTVASARAYNTEVSVNLTKNIIPDIEITANDVIEANTTVEELVQRTNEALKINSDNLKKLVDTSNQTLTRINESEQNCSRE